MSAPRGGDPLDAPAPPGGPQRDDRPDQDSTPQPEPGAPDPVDPGTGDPTVHPSSPPDGPATVPPPEPPAPGPTGEIHARTQAELAQEQLQEENAETSLDQPSS